MDWKDDFGVGIAIIDQQHKKLVEMINILYDHMKAGKSGVVIEELLASLIDYTKVHFKTEEDLFAKHRYPQTASHVAEHEKFVETVGKFNQDYAKKKVGLSIEVLNFLTSWLRDHILIQDKAYGPFLKEQGR
jgi:hemerythrin-like metal-binding protein